MAGNVGAQGAFMLGLDANGAPGDAWRTVGYSPASDIAGTLSVVSGGGASTVICVAGGTTLAQGSTPSVLTTVVPVPIISVPLYVTGLSNATKYHIVIAGVGGTTGINDAQVATVSGISGGGALTGRIKLGAGSWTGMAGTHGVPLTIYSGGTGRMVHTISDVASGAPARYTWLVWNWFGKLIGVGEWTTPGNTRSFRAVQYDPDGLPTGLV